MSRPAGWVGWPATVWSQGTRPAGLFILDARDAVETLRGGGRLGVEYPRGIWRLHKLPGITASAGQPAAAGG